VGDDTDAESDDAAGDQKSSDESHATIVPRSFLVQCDEAEQENGGYADEQGNECEREGARVTKCVTAR